ncbi:MAG: beta-ketoacyl synthase N-terminal-like domain-containing protein [Planctomycetota bacterium]|nr:beta-ketoacyl synthase N-terminal-like domain-containing protein [Planctomycetota bacterium]
MTRPVGIAAYASRCALGNDDQQIDQALADGESAIGPLRGFDASAFGDTVAAQIWTEEDVDEDDPAIRILGPHGRILEHVVRRAYAAADLDQLPAERVGLYVGMGMVDAAVEDLVPAVAASRDADGELDLAKFFKGAYRLIHPLWPLSMLNNVAVGQIATDLDIRGDNLVLASDAVCGVRAILEAARAVREGIVDAAIAAGVSERVCPASLARRRVGVEGVQPMGEGGAALVLTNAVDGVALRLLGGATAHGPRDQRFASERAGEIALHQAGRSEARRLTDARTGVGDLGPGQAAFALARAAHDLAAGEVGLLTMDYDGSGMGPGAGALVVERPA